MEKIRVIIADDYNRFCEIVRDYLIKYEEIEILGIANTDEEEIRMIEELKPEIVITDLMRNRTYSGLKIIEDYSNKKERPEFLVISADEKDDVIKNDVKIGGYINKPFNNYSIIIEDPRRIKAEKVHEQNQLMIQKEIVEKSFWYKILEFFKIRK